MMSDEVTMKTTKKVELHMLGLGQTGFPAFEDFLKLFQSLTGREATPDDVARAKAKYDAATAAHS